MTSMAPEYFNVFSSSMAPNMIKRISKVMKSPCIVEARTLIEGTSQKKEAINAVRIKTSGITLLAGHLRPTKKIPAARIGSTARNAWVVSDMMLI